MGTDDIARRLRRVEGQVRGLQRMIEQERDCEAILTQLMAARSALDQVGLMIFDGYVARCLASDDSQDARQRMGRVLALIFSRYSMPGPGEELSAEELSVEETETEPAAVPGDQVE